MPELPEVEVVRRGLEEILDLPLGIKGFEFYRADLRGPIPQAELANLSGAKLLSITRRAKYLIFNTNQGSILSHLGMTGSWRKMSSQEKMRPHDHICWSFEDGTTLIYNDPRRFGQFDLVQTKSTSENSVSKIENDPRFEFLAIEPLSDEFNAQYLLNILCKSQSPIKVALMDQRKVVGVGNIYASEVLFAAKISPFRKACKVNEVEAKEIVRQIKRILKSAIAKGGSTIQSFLTTKGESGNYQQNHSVYGRSGQACVNCGHKIRSKTQVGRSTFWCPSCQKK